MKTTMKFFAVLTIMLGFAVTTFSQVNNYAYARVVQTIAVTAGTPLQFGNVLRGTANYKTISAANGVLHGTNPSSVVTETSAKFVVAKSLHSEVLLTLTVPASLSATSAPLTTLPITYDAEGGVELGAIGSVAMTPANTTYAVSHTNYPAEYDAASFTVYIGGTATASDTQLGDTYSGLITLQAVYN